MPPSKNNFHGQHTNENLYVFEGAVDCLSHASIAQICGTDWNGYRLSLGGVSGLALISFLENNPQINNVYLCLDNDKPGKEATERLAENLLEDEKHNSINIYFAPPPIGNDYNDTVLFMQEKVKEHKLQTEKSLVPEKQKSVVNKKRSEAVL